MLNIIIDIDISLLVGDINDDILEGKRENLRERDRIKEMENILVLFYKARRDFN